MTLAQIGHPGLFFISLGVAASAFWGASDFLGGLAARTSHVVLVVAVAHTLSLMLLLPVAWVSHSPVPSPRFFILGLCAGACGGLALMLYYQALSLAAMGLTTALTGILTAIIPVAYACVTQGVPTMGQIAGFLLAAVAIALIAYSPSGKTRPLALILAVLAGTCFGLFLIVLQIGKAPGMVWQLIASRLASATLSLLLVLLIQIGRGARVGWLGNTNRYQFVWIAGSAGVLEATGTLLYMGAARAGRLDVAAVLASLYPAVTIVLAALVLKEKTTPPQAWGMALALVAVVLVSI